jgi:hypothetical protein
MRKQNYSSVAATPDDNKTNEDYFGKNYIYEEVYKNPIFQAFNEKCKEVNNICGSLLLDVGEAQIMIGKFWTQIKYGDFERLKEWIRNNYHRKIQVLQRPIHNEIMGLNSGSGVKEYQEWFNKHEMMIE